MKFKRTLAVSMLMLTLLLGSSAVGQSDLADDKKAVACIDIRFKQLFESKAAETFNMESMLNQWSEEQGAQMPFQPEKLERLFGAISAPESVADIMRMESEVGYMPFDFFIVLQLADKDAMDAMMEDMPFEETVEKNGQTFFLGEPEGVLIQRKNPTTLVMGTEDFLMADSFKDVFSDHLKATWGQANDAPVRLAVDMKTPVGLIREAMEMSKEQAPPMFAPMIDVVDNADSMTLSFDPDANEFLAFNAVGVDEANAEELRGVLDGLLGMAKMGMNAELDRMKDDVPALAESFKTIVDRMRATGEGREINIVLEKPEGLEETLVDAMEQARTAAQGMVKLNRFRQVLLSIHNYESAYRRLPLDPKKNDGMHESLSWRLAILPFLEQSRLYDRLDASKAVDGEANQFIADEMPEDFGTDGKNTDVVCIMPEKVPGRFSEIVDGTSGTIVIMEYPSGMPWAERNDLSIDEAVDVFAALEEGEKLAVGFYDGSVRYLKAGIGEDLLRKLLDPADGEVIDWDELDRWSD